MKLEGSCHCGAVRFSVESHEPYPFNLCYCTVCRKTAGSGGFGINLGADMDTLEVQGREHIQIYRAKMKDSDGGEKTSEMERSFCKHCGSALWCWHPSWPEHVHPHASAIDTPLPTPPERQHFMLEHKAPWVEPQAGPQDKTFPGYPDESLAAWHKRHGFHK